MKLKPDYLGLLWLVCAVVLVAGCNTENLTKNMGGDTGIHYQWGESNSLDMATAQPENPNQSAWHRVEFNPDGSLKAIEQGTGSAFKNTMGKIIETAKTARACILAGIICCVVGGVILGLNKRFLNRIGWSLMGVGIGCGVLGGMIPDFGAYFVAIAVLGIIGGLGYMYMQRRHNKAEEIALHSEPPK